MNKRKLIKRKKLKRLRFDWAEILKKTNAKLDNIFVLMDILLPFI